MAEKLLYFPYCDIPENSWTIKSLLYWDKVGIIVPPSFIENPIRHNQFTIDLLQSDLIESIIPHNYVHQVPNFDDGFISLLEDPEFNLEEKQWYFSQGYETEFYIQKFGEKLLKHLVKLKLAQKKDRESYYIELGTSNIIMLYLATVIGKKGHFTPATDNINNLDISFSQKGSKYQINKLRQRLLDDLIPFPVNPNLTKLRRFKDKFHNELHSFRILIESTSLEISKFSNREFQESMYKLKVEEITDKKEKILRELNNSRMGQISFGTICGIVGAAYGFAEENKPMGYFALINAIYSAFQGFGNTQLLTQDYSYLALIDKKLTR